MQNQTFLPKDLCLILHRVKHRGEKLCHTSLVCQAQSIPCEHIALDGKVGRAVRNRLNATQTPQQYLSSANKEKTRTPFYSLHPSLPAHQIAPTSCSFSHLPCLLHFSSSASPLLLTTFLQPKLFLQYSLYYYLILSFLSSALTSLYSFTLSFFMTKLGFFFSLIYFLLNFCHFHFCWIPHTEVPSHTSHNNLEFKKLARISPASFGMFLGILIIIYLFNFVCTNPLVCYFNGCKGIYIQIRLVQVIALCP